MATQQELLIKIKGDIGDLKSKLGQVSKDTDGVTSAVDGVQSKLGGIGPAIATAFSVGAIAGLANQIVTTTADLEAMKAQFSQVFKGTEGEAALAGINKQAGDLGIHADRLMSSWSQFGGQIKGAGISGEEAMNMTSQATEAAANAAAFYDTSLEDASASVASFMKGNFEAGDAIGVYTNATQMGVEAQAKYGKAWADLTEAEKQNLLLDKVTATQELSGAQGQAARESDNLTNSQANLKATWDEFLAIVGKPALGLAKDVIIDVTGKIKLAIDKVKEIKKNWDEWETPLQIIGVLVGALVVALLAFNAATIVSNIIIPICTGVMGAFGAVMAFVTSPITLVILAIGALIAIGILLYKNWDKISEWAGTVWDKVKSKFTEMKNGIGTIFDNIKSAISDKINAAKDVVSTAIDKIKGLFKFSWSFPSLKMPHFSVTGKFSVNPPSVPKLGISWYARGAIFKTPTVLGGMGVGDASNGRGSSPEVVAPLSDLKQMLGLDGNNGNTTINLNGNYSFRDKDDMDYLLNQMALVAQRA